MTLFAPTLLLKNDHLLLRPSEVTDLEGLYGISEESLWTYASTTIQNKMDMKVYLLRANQERKQKSRQQLTIIDKKTNQLIGCSSFQNIFTFHKRLEIGWTWLGKDFQGNGYNQQVKFLMLKYAFEGLKFERVEFRTRGTNLQSQKALSKIGAIKEGILRSYFTEEEERHDVIYYSILKSEWGNLKKTVFSSTLRL